MPRFDTNPKDETTNKRLVRRRSFVKTLAAIAGVFFVGRTVRETTEIAAAQTTSDTNSKFSFSSAISSIKLPKGYENYPKPAYIPRDYQLAEVYIDRPDGFGKGSNELTFDYLNLNHPMGWNNPLSIFVAREPQQQSLGTTEDHIGVQQTFTMTSGKTVRGTYHNGWWELSLDTSNPPPDSIKLSNGEGILFWGTNKVHSLTFQLGNYTVGVRGTRLLGINMDELIQVASSIE